MKVVIRIFVLMALLLFGAYQFVSRPEPTIDRLHNPEAVNNLHLIDENQKTGFAIYRLGEPDADDIASLCALGVREIAVLAGTALDHEVAYRDRCPGLQVVYNHEDDLSPLDAEWLEAFDAWVDRARNQGLKIAFRCTCGCHRTGRLAAYYQMKHRGLSARDAWDLALARGYMMHAVDYFSSLQEQVLALEEHIQGVPCTQGEHCVAAESRLPQRCQDPLSGCGWGAFEPVSGLETEATERTTNAGDAPT